MQLKSYFLTSIYIVTYLFSTISPTTSTPIPHKDITSGNVTVLESLLRRRPTEMDLDGVETVSGQVPNSIPQAVSSTVNHDSFVVPLGEPLDARGRTMKLCTVPFQIAALPGVPTSIRIPADDMQVDEQDVAAMNKFISEIMKCLDAQPSTTPKYTARRRLSNWIYDLKHFRNFKNLNSVREHKLRVVCWDSSHLTDGVEGPPPTLGEPLEAQGRRMVKRKLPPRLCGWQGIPKSINTPLDLTTINADDLENMGRFINEILGRLKAPAGANDPMLNDLKVARAIFFTWVSRLKSHWGFNGVMYQGQHSKFDPGCPQNPPPHNSASSTLPPTVNGGLLQNPVAQPHTQSHKWQSFPQLPNTAILRNHVPMFNHPGLPHIDIHPSVPQLPPLQSLDPKPDIPHPGKPKSWGLGNMPQGGTSNTNSPGQGPSKFLQTLQPPPEHKHTQIPEKWGPGRC
ncbi:hypothetical protein H0H93_009839 [Arthromyces matolae]|nr:hypothetical protein H0H93_009839 [Arthromyces matolae]